MNEKMIGFYRLVRELGRGGQGSAWLAEDTRLKRRVVVKLLNSAAQLSTRAVERFRREAEIASGLEHPGIATVYEAGVHEGIPFIAMRFVEGVTLASIIEAGGSFCALSAVKSVDSASDTASVLFDFESTPSNAVPASEPSNDDTIRETPHDSKVPDRKSLTSLLAIIEKSASAIAFAHGRGVYHRDIKPSNIMVTPDLSPVILDFGLARQADDGHELTMTGDVFGTPAYMAPEQVAGRREMIDATTDVWALGVTLYETVTGRRPFEAPTREGLYRSILGRHPIEPRRLNPSIPRDVEIVILTALEKGRARRYRTAAEFAEDLRRARMHLPIRARRTPMVVRAAQWCRRNPSAAGLIAAIVVMISVAAGILGVVLTRRSENRSLLAAELDRLDAEIRAERLAGAEESLSRAWSLGLETEDGEAIVARLNALRESDRRREADRRNLERAKALEDNRNEWRSLEQSAPTLLLRNGSNNGADFVAFSPDGRLIVTTSADRVMRIWDAESGHERWTLPINARRGSAFFSDDGRWIAVDGSHVWTVVDLSARATLRTIEKERSTGLGFLSGTHTLIAVEPGFVRYDRLTQSGVETTKRPSEIDESEGRVFFGRGAIVWDKGSAVEFFEPSTLDRLATIPFQLSFELYGVHPSADGQRLLLRGAQRFMIFDVRERREIGSIILQDLAEAIGADPNRVHEYGATLSDDGRTVFAALVWDDVVAIDVATGKLIAHRRLTGWMSRESPESPTLTWLEDAKCLVMGYGVRPGPWLLRYEKLGEGSPQFVRVERLLAFELVGTCRSGIALKSTNEEESRWGSRRTIEVVRPILGRSYTSTTIDSAAIDGEKTEGEKDDSLAAAALERMENESIHQRIRRLRRDGIGKDRPPHVTVSENRAYLAFSSGGVVRVVNASSGRTVAERAVDGTVLAVTDDGREVGVESIVDEVEVFLKVPMDGRPVVESETSAFRRLELRSGDVRFGDRTIKRTFAQQWTQVDGKMEYLTIAKKFMLEFGDDSLMITRDDAFFGPDFDDPGPLESVMPTPSGDRLILNGRFGVAIATPVAEELAPPSGRRQPFAGRRTSGTAWASTMSTDGRLVATGFGEIGEVVVWDTTQNRTVGVIELGSDGNALGGNPALRPLRARPIAFSHDDKVLWIKVADCLVMVRVARLQKIATIDLDGGVTILAGGVFGGDPAVSRRSFVFKTSDEALPEGPNVVSVQRASSHFRQDAAVEAWLDSVAKLSADDPIPLPPRPGRIAESVVARCAARPVENGSFDLEIRAVVPPGFSADPMPYGADAEPWNVRTRDGWKMTNAAASEVVYSRTINPQDVFPHGAARDFAALSWTVKARRPTDGRIVVSDPVGFTLPIPAMVIVRPHDDPRSSTTTVDAYVAAAWRDGAVVAKRDAVSKMKAQSGDPSPSKTLRIMTEYVSLSLSADQADTEFAKAALAEVPDNPEAKIPKLMIMAAIEFHEGRFAEALNLQLSVRSLGQKPTDARVVLNFPYYSSIIDKQFPYVYAHRQRSPIDPAKVLGESSRSVYR